MNSRNIIATSVIATVVAFATPSSGDVYSNALYWARCAGIDNNNTGSMARKSQRDSLNRVTQYSDTSSQYGASHQNGPRFTTETIRFPYRGVERTSQCVYLHQTVTAADPVAGTGTFKPTRFVPPTDVRSALANSDFTLAFRIRPDLEQIMFPATFFRSSGDRWGGSTGFWVALERPSTNIVGNATNIMSQLKFYYGGNGTKFVLPHAHCAVSLGDWNDVVISVSGSTKKVAVLVSRGGHLWNGETNSEMADNQSYVARFNVDSDKSLSGNGTNVHFGGWDGDAPNDLSWSATSLDFYTHSFFRGSVQSFAVWTTALTTAQMREAAAWPRTDLWRVGVEDGAANEFNGSGAAATVDVDADFWMLQKDFAAGASATFRFPLDAVGEAKAPQLLRIKAANDSAAGTLSASVNGTVLTGRRKLEAGGTVIWFVPERLLQGGAINTIVVSRLDSGSSPVKFDAVSFGGSLQYGLDDNSCNEFCEESKYQMAIWDQVYDMMGGNWLDGPRALLRADSGSSYTSTTLNFEVPREIIERGHRWGLKFRMLNASGNGHRVRMTLNGTVLGEFVAGQEHDVKVPKGLVLAGMQNQLTFANVSTGGSGAMAPDYVRLYLKDLPPEGTVILFR